MVAVGVHPGTYAPPLRLVALVDHEGRGKQHEVAELVPLQQRNLRAKIPHLTDPEFNTSRRRTLREGIVY